MRKKKKFQFGKHLGGGAQPVPCKVAPISALSLSDSATCSGNKCRAFLATEMLPRDSIKRDVVTSTR
jgi:hypothetical protein